MAIPRATMEAFGRVEEGVVDGVSTARVWAIVIAGWETQAVGPDGLRDQVEQSRVFRWSPLQEMSGEFSGPYVSFYHLPLKNTAAKRASPRDSPSITLTSDSICRPTARRDRFTGPARAPAPEPRTWRPYLTKRSAHEAPSNRPWTETARQHDLVPPGRMQCP